MVTVPVYLIRSHFVSITLLLTLLLSFSVTVQAASFQVDVDRTRLAENESLTLLIRTDNVISTQKPDLSALSVDFEILTQQVRTNIQIINGQNRSEKVWEVTLLPKRSGSVIIPAIILGDEESLPITLDIQAAPVSAIQSAEVFLDSEIDQKGSIYVQQQLIYTLRLYYATSISDHGLTDLELPDTLMMPLGNRRDYESRIDGRLYNVAEWQFAIYPQRSGPLVLPAQTFSGRIRMQNRYSLGGLKQIRIKSPEHNIQVLPIPEQFPSDQTWLPAKSLTLSEQWSGDFSQWQAGSPLTRTLQLSAKGLTAAQLPPLKISLPDGVRQYPEQPKQEDQSTEAGFNGLKTLNIALIPVRDGSLVLPKVEIPWWNTETDQLEYVQLNTLNLNIKADPNQPAAQVLPSLAETKTVTPIIQEDNSIFWQIISLISSLLVCALTVLYWKKHQAYKHLTQRLFQKNTLKSDATPLSRQEQTVFRKAMLSACQQNQAQTAWQTWQQWQQYETPVIDKAVETEFKQALEELQAHLFGPQAGSTSWKGKRLADQLNKLKTSKKKEEKVLASLYPQ